MPTPHHELFWRAAKADKAFRILVWGPSDTHPKYSIRSRVRDVLLGRFAVVNFSEELVADEPEPDPADWLAPIATRERLHAEQATVVYVIAVSPGAMLEVILFSRYGSLREKMHIWLADDFRATSFTEKVFEDVIRGRTTGTVHRVPAMLFTPDYVAEQCLVDASRRYMASYPEGPPNLGL